MNRKNFDATVSMNPEQHRLLSQYLELDARLTEPFTDNLPIDRVSLVKSNLYEQYNKLRADLELSRSLIRENKELPTELSFTVLGERVNKMIGSIESNIEKK